MPAERSKEARPVATSEPRRARRIGRHLARLLPIIEFGADGTISRFAACNTYTGTYTTDGASLTLGPLATTKIACQRPASAVEAEYLRALSGVTTWAIDLDGRLLLAGSVPLRCARG